MSGLSSVGANDLLFLASTSFEMNMCVFALLVLVVLPINCADKVVKCGDEDCQMTSSYMENCTIYLCKDICLIPDCESYVQKDVEDCPIRHCSAHKSKSDDWLIAILLTVILTTTVICVTYLLRGRRIVEGREEQRVLVVSFIRRNGINLNYGLDQHHQEEDAEDAIFDIDM